MILHLALLIQYRSVTDTWQRHIRSKNDIQPVSACSQSHKLHVAYIEIEIWKPAAGQCYFYLVLFYRMVCVTVYMWYLPIVVIELSVWLAAADIREFCWHCLTPETHCTGFISTAAFHISSVTNIVTICGFSWCETTADSVNKEGFGTCQKTAGFSIRSKTDCCDTVVVIRSRTCWRESITEDFSNIACSKTVCRRPSTTSRSVNCRPNSCTGWCKNWAIGHSVSK